MKLITLNIWGGHVKNKLLDFVCSNKDVDIFCFQEVYHQASSKVTTEDRYVCLNIFDEIENQLPEHHGLFCPIVNNIYGMAMFVKNNFDIVKHGEIKIHDNPEYPGVGPTHSRYLQWMELGVNNQAYTIINVHGLWNGQGKTDTTARVLQSQNIKKFVDTVTQKKILCGDFNLRPDTESISIISEGMDDHIEKNNIISTRTSYYEKEEKYADYIFTSTDIQVKAFEVLKDEVSDHAPLLVDFI